MMKCIVRAIVLMVVLFLSVASVTWSGQSALPGGGNLGIRIGMGALGPTLDPHASVSTLSFTPFYAVYDTLTRIEHPNAVVRPALATQWRNIDDTTWEFTLRKGVKFQNGEEFNAKAVKFSIERVIDPKNRLMARSRIPLITRADIVDDYTVRIITSRPDPLLAARLSVIFIIPPQYFQQVGAEGFAAKGIGTGAWQVVEFVPEEKVVLKAFRDSWRGTPRASEVVLQALSDDAARVAALRAGDVDIIQNLPVDQIDVLKAAGFNIVTATLGRIHFANLASTRNTPLDDRRVRLAINYAVDKAAILRHVLKGMGEIAQGQMIGTNGVGHNPEVKAFPYDVAKARELLKEAGYPNGFRIRWDGPSGAYLQDKATQEAIVAYLEQVGIKVELSFLEQATFIDKLNKGQLAPISFLGWNYFPIMDADFTYVWFTTTVADNLYNNKEFDRLFDESRTTLDPAKRLAILKRLAVITHEDPPGLFLFHPPDIFGLGTHVTGFTPRPDTVIWLDSLAKSR
jgi:peptide/nickel transport system substrate-binding protein